MNKRLHTLFMMLAAMLYTSIAVPVLAQDISIGTKTELEAFRDAVNGGNTYAGNTVTLTANITVDGWAKGIGDWDALSFQGTFDGGGNVITLTDATASLFSVIGNEGTVKNLGVTGTVTASRSAGGIATNNSGTILNCFTSVNVTCTAGTYAGGIAGDNSGTIRNCYTTGAITGTGNAGGIAGNNASAMGSPILSACYATGTITGNKAGGIVGINGMGGKTEKCIALNTGGISGSGTAPVVRRIAADNDELGTLATNYASPGIDGTWNNIGDGKQDGVTLTDDNFTNVTDASGAFTDWPTGDDGWNLNSANLPTLKVFKGDQPVKDITRESAITKPLLKEIKTADDLKAFRDAVNGGETYEGETVTLTAPITVDAWATGINKFKGTFNGDGYVITMTNATASLFKTINAGGIVQYLGVNATINASVKVGGIAATNRGTIQRCYTEGTITSTEGSSSGIADNEGTIEDCYSTASVTITTGGYYAGGIAGGNSEGTILRCYATGAISSPGSAGIAGTGIAGAGISPNSVQNCIALNESITGTGAHARIANGSVTLANNYASHAIDGSWDNKGLDKKDGADLTAANFTNVRDASGAFTDWPTGDDGWDLTTDNLPTLKGFKAAQPAEGITRKSVMLKLTIATADDLKAFRDAVNGGETYEGLTVKLTAPITVTGWTEGISTFKGTFDGGGFTIDITGTKSLFYTIGEKGIVQNLGVTGNVADDAYNAGGGIAVSNNGTIQNCFTSVNVTITTSAGGIAGNNNGTIQNCYTTGTIKGTDAGGIAGFNSGTIRNCYTTGAITGSNSAGGIAGYNGSIGSGDAAISACYATGTITGNKAGGIAGSTIDGTIANCIALNTGGISGSDSDSYPSVGRIVGEYTTTPTANHASPGIPGTWNNIGDGKQDGVTLTDDNFTNVRDASEAFATWPTSDDGWELNSANLPTLKVFKGDQPVKDITRAEKLFIMIATAADLATFREAVNGGNTYEGKTVTLTADITLTGDWTPIGNSTNKFAGTFEGGGHCISGLSVTINQSGIQYGGLFGVIDKSGIVQNLGVKGTVSVTSTDNEAYAGGITGQNLGTIQNCYTTVTVTASTGKPVDWNDLAGGIAGINYNKISNCYTMGNSAAVMYAGGIVGINTGIIEQCYATGAIEATHTVMGSAGGIVGYSLSGSHTRCIALNSSITGASSSGRIAADSEGDHTFADNYASPAIPGTWINIAVDGINGANLDNDNFIDTGSGASAFTDDWLPAIWDFTDAANLPALKTIGLTENKPIAGQDAMPARTDFLEKTVKIEAAVTYDAATHKDNNITVLSGGTFTVNTDAASLKKLTIEDGGQVVATKAFTCKELLAPRTLGNRWTAYGSPVVMKAIAKKETQFYTRTGYAKVEEQGWEDLYIPNPATSCPLTSPTLVSVEGNDIAVTLTATAEESTPLAIPADVAATEGSALSTGIFVFCQNPTLRNITIPVAYILNAEGTRFERTAPAIVKPFEAYMVANAATSSAVMSLRAGGIPTANEPIAPADFRIWGANGQLHLSADTASKVAIYDLSGRLIRSFILTGEQTLNLGRGLYLVHSNNITYKVSL